MSLDHLYEPYSEPEPLPNCPVCGEEADTYYIDPDNEILGCESCIKEVFSVEWIAERG